MVRLATLTLEADQLGETRLILSAPLLARTDGSELPILRVAQGTYQVSLATETPTPTATEVSTSTPTATETPTNTPTETSVDTPTITSTPTVTLQPTCDYNALFNFSCDWFDQNSPFNLDAEEPVDAADLLMLIESWHERPIEQVTPTQTPS